MIAYGLVDICSVKPFRQLSIKEIEQQEIFDCSRRLLIYRMKYIPQALAVSEGERITQCTFNKVDVSNWKKINKSGVGQNQNLFPTFPSKWSSLTSQELDF